MRDPRRANRLLMRRQVQEVRSACFEPLPRRPGWRRCIDVANFDQAGRTMSIDHPPLVVNDTVGADMSAMNPSASTIAACQWPNLLRPYRQPDPRRSLSELAI